jgi:hypothetical protein
MLRREIIVTRIHIILLASQHIQILRTIASRHILVVVILVAAVVAILADLVVAAVLAVRSEVVEDNYL